VAGVPEVDLTHMGGVAQSATDLKDFADAGYDPATDKVEGVKLADDITNVGGVAVLGAIGFIGSGTTQSQAGITDIDGDGSTADELILASTGVDQDDNFRGMVLTLTASGEDSQPCIIDDADNATDTVSCVSVWETTPTAGGGDSYAIRNAFGEVPTTINVCGARSAIPFTVLTDAGNNNTQVKTDLTDANYTDNQFGGGGIPRRGIYFSSGNAKGLASKVLTFTTSTDIITFTSVGKTPADGVTGCIY
jgi:hypothetical protein